MKILFIILIQVIFLYSCYPSRPPSISKWNTEQYDSISENEILYVANKPLSTFSIDVDTASYSNMRRFLQSGRKPPQGAIRT
ncbi:MAG: von Willebrand factor type A domain-containing protein, partial [Spirochaetota bacterium]